MFTRLLVGEHLRPKIQVRFVRMFYKKMGCTRVSVIFGNDRDFMRQFSVFRLYAIALTYEPRDYRALIRTTWK